MLKSRLARRARRSAALFVALAVLLCLCPAPGTDALAAADGMLRVRLTRLGARTSISFQTTCAYYVEGNTNRPIPAGAAATVSVSGDSLRLSVNGAVYDLGEKVTLARGRSGVYGARFTSPGFSNLFMGDLMFYISGGALVPVLNIYIEDYLYGVVAYEMSNTWPLEALKAQAVAARNYALRCKASRSSRAYHLVDTSSDQVFKGYNAAYARVMQAVNETRGMALYAGGSPAACYYTASNGGQTESSKNAWGGALSYSTVRDDPYDLASASAKKSVATIRRDASGLDARLQAALEDGIAAQLSRKGISAAAITRIAAIEPRDPKYASPSRLYQTLRFTLEVAGRDASGAAATATVQADIGTYGALETWYGLSINSGSNETVWVEEDAAAFRVVFRRWGHGIGMSQRGAQVMANQGLDYADVLSFYYPGTQLKNLALADATGNGLHAGDAPEPAPLGQVVCVSEAPVYQSASSAAAALGSVPAGATVEVYAVESGWALIGYGSLRGWAETGRFVLPGEAAPTPTPSPAAGAGRAARVVMSSASGRLYLRSGPSTATAAVTTVGHGDSVAAFEESGEWTRVRTAAGKDGYLKTKYLLVLEADPTPEITLIPITPAPTATPGASPAPSADATPDMPPDSTPDATPEPVPSATPASTATPEPVPGATPAPTPDASLYARVKLSSSSSRLNLRARASTGSAILARLRHGDYVRVLIPGGTWSRIETSGGQIGYVQTRYLRRAAAPTAAPTASATTAPAAGATVPVATAAPTAVPEPTRAPDGAMTEVSGDLRARVYVGASGGSLNVRQGPSTDTARVTTVRHGSTVTLLAYGEEWARVRTQRGNVGYLKRKYLIPEDADGGGNAGTTGDGGADVDGGGEVVQCDLRALVGEETVLRAQPNDEAWKLSALAAETRVIVTAYNDDWAYVDTGSQKGFVRKKHLKVIG